MFTETVQVPPAAIVAPLKEIEPAPATGVNVGAPQPVVVAEGVPATTIAPGEVGNVSVKATLLRAFAEFEFVMMKVSVDTPPARIGFGANCLEIDGGSTAFKVAVATLSVVVPLSVVDGLLLMFECGPAVVAVTLTWAVHEPLAGIVPPLKVRAVLPAAGAHVAPVQVVEAEGVAATCVPAGKASVKAAPVSCVVFVFVSVNVRVETPFTAIGFGENAFAIVGLIAVVQTVNVTLSMLLSEPEFVLPDANV